MFVVGLTGGIGSGKSAVSRLLERQGIAVIDADRVARDVVEPGEPALNEIAGHFGPGILNEDGRLDRARLRGIVFADADARRWLEALLHPLIRARIEHHIRTAESPYCMLVSPLLLETGQLELVDHVVVVDVSEETQIERTVARDDNSREQVERIMAAQIDRRSRLAGADSIIDNSGTPAALSEATLKLHQTLLELARNRRDR